MKSPLRNFNRKLIRFISKLIKRTHNNPNGTAFYTEVSNPGLQRYFIENKEQIFHGIVPKRYTIISELTPGERILEIGSAEGTQSLVLSQTKDIVAGYEKMDFQFRTALELKTAWEKLGKRVDNCHFVNTDILSLLGNERQNAFDQIDTILMSRVIYHLRDRIPDLMQFITKSEVRYLVLVGCPEREARWKSRGEAGDPMGRYAYYATHEGMQSLGQSYGFEVADSRKSDGKHEPIVILERLR